MVILVQNAGDGVIEPISERDLQRGPRIAFVDRNDLLEGKALDPRTVIKGLGNDLSRGPVPL